MSRFVSKRLEEDKDRICYMYSMLWLSTEEIARNIGYSSSSSVQRALRRWGVLRSKAEQLDDIGIRYIHQLQVDGGKFILDFYIPSLKVVIECNGDYWHNLENRKQRDDDLKKYVMSTGCSIIFLWEHEINDEWFWVGDYIFGED